MALPPRQTGTFADSIEQLPDLAPARPTQVSLAPAPSAGEVFAAQKEIQLGENLGGPARIEREGWEQMLDALDLPRHQNPSILWGSDQAHLESWSSLANGRVDKATQERLIVDAMRRAKARDPKAFAGIPDTIEGLKKYWFDEALKRRHQAQDVAGRSEGLGSTLAGFAGSFVGSAQSPEFVPSMAIGGVGSGSIARIAARETLANGVAEAVVQPGIAQTREFYGEKLTFGEAAANVTLSALLGGALEAGLTGGGRVLSPIASRAVDKLKAAHAERAAAQSISGAKLEPVDLFAELDNREISALTREVIGEDKLTPDERAAIATLERDQELGEASPFTDNPAGAAEHGKRLGDAINDLIDNRRPREFTPDAGAGARATGPERPPAGSTAAARPQASGKPHDRLDEFAGELERRGIPAPIARGAAAGLIAESGGVLNARGPVTGATHGDRALGYGQWLFERQAELVKRYGPNPTHAEQLDFLAWELKGGDAGGKSVLSAKDEVDALGRYIRDFMRPGKGRETDGDIERGLAALGRKGESAPPAPRSAGAAEAAADPHIARLRAEALELGDEIVGLSRRPDGEAVNVYATRVPSSSVLVDADRFQFKAGGDEFGVTERLRGVEEWDPVSAGRVILWQDNEGRLFVADGHQRTGLAKRISSQSGTDIPLDAAIWREADGVTAEDARVMAALKNIAEDSGTVLDAAKIGRGNAEALERAAKRLPPKSPLVRDGRALARLSDDAFGAVYNERIPADQAAVIGHLLPDDPDKHLGMVDLLIKTNPANRAQAQSIVRQAIAAGFHSEEQLDLLGSSTSVSSLFLEKAKILERGLARLRKMRLVHKTAANEADELERKGSTIARAESEKEAQANAEAAAIIDRLAYRAGPVADALNDAARELAAGDVNLTVGVDRFVKRIRELDLADLDAGSRGGPDAGGIGREGDAGEADPSLFGEPADPGQPSLGELLTATERFSDPDGPAVKQQAESLEHDFKADRDLAAEWSSFRSAGLHNELNADVGKRLTDGQLEAIADAHRRKAMKEGAGANSYLKDKSSPSTREWMDGHKAAWRGEPNDYDKPASWTLGHNAGEWDRQYGAGYALARDGKLDPTLAGQPVAHEDQMKGSPPPASIVPPPVEAKAPDPGAMLAELGAKPVGDGEHWDVDIGDATLTFAVGKMRGGEAPNFVDLKMITSSKRGAGTAAMQKVVDLADKHGVAIELFAKGFDQVPTDKLIEWYGRFGFENLEDRVPTAEEMLDPDHLGVDMSREPRAAANDAAPAARGLPSQSDVDRLIAEVAELGVALDLTYPRGAKHITLDMIERKAGEKGSGAEAMEYLTEFADNHGLAVELSASKSALVPYYERFGFHADEPFEEGDIEIAMSREPGAALDLGEAVDPAIAGRQAQEVALKAAAPLRAAGDVDQLGEIGLELFGAADQGKLTFRLDEEGGEISADDLLAELEADDKAIQTLRNCL